MKGHQVVTVVQVTTMVSILHDAHTPVPEVTYLDACTSEGVYCVLETTILSQTAAATHNLKDYAVANQ